MLVVRAVFCGAEVHVMGVHLTLSDDGDDDRCGEVGLPVLLVRRNEWRWKPCGRVYKNVTAQDWRGELFAF